jgi:hypothetical protein
LAYLAHKEKSTMQEISRRNLGTTLAGLIAGGSIATAKGNVSPIGLVSLKPEQSEAAKILCGTFFHPAQILVKRLSPACPDLGEFLAEQFQQLGRNVADRYPNLAAVVAYYAETLTPDVQAALVARSEAEQEQAASEAAGLQARRDQASENPPEWLIQEAADYLRESDDEEFAGDLGLARAFWRKYRDLVETNFLPERFQEDCNYQLNDDCMQPGYAKDLPTKARDLASTWIRNGVAEENRGYTLA